ncbi:hypothetical protein ACO3VM_05815 [Methanocaldococcus sp. 10A]
MICKHIGIYPDDYGYAMTCKNANLNGGLMFVNGCDSYKLRYGIKRYCPYLTYIGTSDKM